MNSYESYNKMSLHNLATVFGPTMIRPPGSSTLNSSSSGSSGGGGGSSGSGGGSGGNSSGSTVNSDQFTAGAIDAMAQAGILLIFLKRKSEKISLENAWKIVPPTQHHPKLKCWDKKNVVETKF